MPARDLPARPHLDHLKNEAKALRKAFEQRDARAVQRVSDSIGDRDTLKLSDAQRVVAREFGFSTWALLRAHVQSSRGSTAAIDAFLRAAQEQDRERAKQILGKHPSIARDSLHVAATLGLAPEAKRLLEEDAAQISTRIGNPAADPLLFLGYSPFHGESAERDVGLLETTRVLLEAGADPNTRDAQYGVPVLHAVTGQRSVLPIARLLLDAGANPTDGESIFHAAEHFHEDALELLLSRGADLNYVGDWGNTAPYFLLRWWDVARMPNVRRGLEWVLDHGANPNIRCANEQETCLHVAARRGQDVAIVRLLLDHGADVNARRGDGSTAWLLASRAGFDEIASLLEQAGAETQSLTLADELLAACGRGDADAARGLATPELLRTLSAVDLMVLPDSAGAGRWSTVAACISAGFPVDTTESTGATATHYAALRGNIDMVQLLLGAKPDLSIRDREHSSTPIGWAAWGSDFVRDPSGDYPATIRTLAAAGGRLAANEHLPQQEAARAAYEDAVDSDR